MSQSNVLFILADQLRAISLPRYGETQIATPNLDRLAREGVTLTNAIATCPVCTPYRGMLVTGRHPQTTGHIVNSTVTRHDEISVADAFAHAGYRTAWVGKWHLHRGAWPANNVPDWVPEGRDRLGFQHWRAYNQHMVYFNGWIHQLPGQDWIQARWEGYETDALGRYAMEFMDLCRDSDEPFCCFVSPQPPHNTFLKDKSPAHYFDQLPAQLDLPPNVPENQRDACAKLYREYLAMTLAVEDMVGQLLEYLDRTGLAENTLVVFTSDHGTQGGAHGLGFWDKQQPYRESLHIPLLARLPGTLPAGRTVDALHAPVDFFPTLCSLCDVPIPRTVEGFDNARAWCGQADAPRQDAILTMNFTRKHDHFENSWEWRGVRTENHMLTRWLDGRVQLFDVAADPLQQRDLADSPAHADLRRGLETRLAALQKQRRDVLQPCDEYRCWHDAQRRVVRNAFGPLRHPESAPDWSLLT